MPEKLVMERIMENLARLRLPGVRQTLPEVLEAAQSGSWSHLTFLDRLLQEETQRKEQRRMEAALHSSGLPFVKTIDDFDFSFQPGLDRRMVMNLFDLSFMESRMNVLFLGPPGVGKTHLSAALAVKACQCGKTIHFTTMADLIHLLGTDRSAGWSNVNRRPYQWANLVIVDEVGYTPIDREECNLFYRFVAMRYERASTIITSNKAFDEWAELFNDTIIVTAILDRLLHHSVIVNIKGDSFRLRGLKEKEEGKTMET